MYKVIYSTNGNHDYEFFAPLVAHAWRNFGWEPVVILSSDVSSVVRSKLSEQAVKCVELPDVEGCSSVTAIQTSRIYAACNEGDSYVMTSDVDMFPLSDFWPKDGKLRVTGWDITGYPNPAAHVPICYVQATSDKWREFMEPSSEDWVASMVDGLREIGGLNGNWEADQELLTKRVRGYGEHLFEKVRRYCHAGIGRVCRSGWNEGVARLRVQPQIDCHVLRPGYTQWDQISSVMKTAGIYAGWMDAYVESYCSARAEAQR